MMNQNSIKFDFINVTTYLNRETGKNETAVSFNFYNIRNGTVKHSRGFRIGRRFIRIGKLSKETNMEYDFVNMFFDNYRFANMNELLDTISTNQRIGNDLIQLDIQKLERLFRFVQSGTNYLYDCMKQISKRRYSKLYTISLDIQVKLYDTLNSLRADNEERYDAGFIFDLLQLFNKIEIELQRIEI